MSFWNRLRQAAAFAVSGKTVSALRPSWESTQPSYAMAGSFEVLVREGYRKNELIWACINRTADTGAQIKLKMTESATGEVVTAHPLLTLIRKPNPLLSEAEFWGATITYLKLAGRAVFEIERTNGGQPIALWPLRPDRVQITRGTNRPTPRAYIYTVPGKPPQTLEAKDVLDFQLFDPLDQFTAYPPVGVAARVGDVDNSATDFIKLLFEHGAVPMGVLKTTQVLMDQDVTDIRRRWAERYGGYENWTEPAVLDRDAEYQRTGLTLNELGFGELDSRDEARICMVLDVPPILVGAKVGLDRATYSNYETAQRAWWQNTIIPLYESLLDVINSQLLPQFGDTSAYILSWDLSAIAALSENADAVFKRGLSAFQAGLFTLNQALEYIGMANLPNGDYYLRPSSAQMILLTEAAVKPEPEPEPEPKPEPVQDTQDKPDDETEDNTEDNDADDMTGNKSYTRNQVNALRELARAIEGKAEPMQISPAVNVTLPSITINVPEQPAPMVNVEPPSVTVNNQPADVKVDPQITVLPAPVVVEQNTRARVIRDSDGNITGIEAQ